MSHPTNFSDKPHLTHFEPWQRSSFQHQTAKYISQRTQKTFQTSLVTTRSIYHPTLSQPNSEKNSISLHPTASHPKGEKPPKTQPQTHYVNTPSNPSHLPLPKKNQKIKATHPSTRTPSHLPLAPEKKRHQRTRNPQPPLFAQRLRLNSQPLVLCTFSLLPFSSSSPNPICNHHPPTASDSHPSPFTPSTPQ